ncbi:MAG: four helix bundle protein [Acidobacteriia bacterium]|nr:four helix bundle protein [Terriglobia bacterium]
MGKYRVLSTEYRVKNSLTASRRYWVPSWNCSIAGRRVWRRQERLCVLHWREYLEGTIGGLFPKRETYGLADQMRRAAVSVPSNIAEGQGYANRREFLRFLRHSRGSLFELETQLRIATRLKYVSDSESNKLLLEIDEISRMLSGLANSLKELNTSDKSEAIHD